MAKKSKYTSRKPDNKGYVDYTDAEHKTWSILYERQMPLVKSRACTEFLEGITNLEFSATSIPQIPDINKKLISYTGWSVEPVEALIGFKEFFTLLANRKFPAATFIRTREELDYLQEPDIFHEIYGHCPMLTNQAYADFVQKYGELALTFSPKDRTMLARIFWFTIEFGLLNTKDGQRIYGGGILSSIAETPYSLESDRAKRDEFDVINVLRTPYRIDIKQPIYYVIDNLDELYNIFNRDLLADINTARELGAFAPLFPPKDNDTDQKLC